MIPIFRGWFEFRNRHFVSTDGRLEGLSAFIFICMRIISIGLWRKIKSSSYQPKCSRIWMYCTLCKLCLIGYWDSLISYFTHFRLVCDWLPNMSYTYLYRDLSFNNKLSSIPDRAFSGLKQLKVLWEKIYFQTCNLFVNRIREMISFELGKEVEKDVLRLVTRLGQRKHFGSPWDSIPHGDSEFFFVSGSWRDEKRLTLCSLLSSKITR